MPANLDPMRGLPVSAPVRVITHPLLCQRGLT